MAVLPPIPKLATVVGADPTVLRVFGTRDFFALKNHARVLDAGHLPSFIHSFKQVRSCEGKSDIGAPPGAAMSTLASDEIVASNNSHGAIPFLFGRLLSYRD